MKKRILYVLLSMLLLYGCARTTQDNVQATSIQLPHEHSPKNSIKVSVTLSLAGDIYIDTVACPKETFLAELKKKGDPERLHVIVSADGAMTYEKVLSIVREIKNAGYGRISLALRTE